MTLKNNFSDFGKSFQEKLAYLILIDRPFSEQIEEVLELEFFELKYLRVFTQTVFEYRKRYKTHPSVETMTTLLKTELDSHDDLTKESILEYFHKMFESSMGDSEFIKERSLEFCKKQKLRGAMLQSIELLQNSKFSDIKQIIDQALKLGSDTNYGHDFIKDFEERYKPNFRNPVSTGWPVLDAITGGGNGKKELSVVIASSGSGKSMCLVAQGAAALLDGKTVVHYTLELSDAVIGKRYDAAITGIPLTQLNDCKDQVQKMVADVPGSLTIKEYSPHEADVNTLRNHLSRLNSRRERGVDLIIVDYGDLLRPIRQYDQKRTELGATYEAMRSMAKEFDCSVITASQSNRNGAKESILTMESIAEAYEKCFVADFVFSLSRTVEDRQHGSGKIYIAKNRNGPDGKIFYAKVDWSKVHMDILKNDQSWDVVGNQAEKNQKKKLYKLAQQYKEELLQGDQN